MALNWPNKSPGERLDYSINWAPPLGTDTIVTSTWVISDPGLTTDAKTNGPKLATIWLLSGTPNTPYTVTNTVTTAAGRIFVQAVNIRVVNATA